MGMSEQLQQAYNALMVKAPGAAFQKARALYLNKYPLPQADGSALLRRKPSELCTNVRIRGYLLKSGG